jgi:hypothetical protein
MLIGWKSITYENFRELLILLGVHLRGRRSPAEKWAFTRRSLIFRVGGENKK